MGQRTETDDYINLLEKNSNKKKFIKKMTTTFSFDESLPSLPVPDLNKTLDKYLESTIPFVNSIDRLNTERLVENFKSNYGPRLDFLLRQRAKNKKNWLEQYWLDYAYHEWRYPVAPFVNTTGLVVGSDDVEDINIPVDLNIQLANISMQTFYYMKFFQELRQ